MNKKMREIMSQIEILTNEANVLFEAKDLDKAEQKIQEIEDLEREYKIAEKLFKDEKEKVNVEDIKKNAKNDKIANFAENIKNIMLNKMTEGNSTDGGYTVPEDVLTDVEKLRESEFTLEQLVSVEAVTTNKGQRTFKKRSQQTGFTKVGEGGKIGAKTTPQFSRLSYEIKKYAGYFPVTTELLDDSDQNIYQILIDWIAGDSRATRNRLILEAVKTKVETKLSSIDDIKYALNVTLGQSFKTTSKIITNDDGLQYLDTLKDSNGNYLLKSNPTDALKPFLACGINLIPVVVVPNQVLANEEVKTGESVTSKKIPFIIGDLQEGIKLFDRKKLNIVASNVAVVGSGEEALNAYEEDLTLFRGIEREDVKVRDEEAFVNGYIEISTAASV